MVLRPPECVKKGCWCHGGHPLLGRWLPLSVPPETMDQGLFGELSMQPVTLLRPCVLQYPNLATQLTHIQISFAVCLWFSQRVSVVVAAGPCFLKAEWKTSCYREGWKEILSTFRGITVHIFLGFDPNVFPVEPNFHWMKTQLFCPGRLL